MELIKPSKKYESSWYQAIEEFRTSGQPTEKIWEIPGNHDNLEKYIDDLQKHSKGIALPAAWVPYTIFWLVDGIEFIGIVSLRHELNDYLKKVGGHIGYEIRPSQRGKGYGNKILELALIKAKKIGLKKVIISCDDDNVASRKIIEKNGGRLDEIIDIENGLKRRYWINLF